ncbi:AAA family ATPase [Streptomyces sp. B21-108]|uniref:HelD family protein n=1 Tax=Streptomyces sp. B21-108 TaxID=3039419 RepID=UPI002FF23DA4
MSTTMRDEIIAEEQKAVDRAYDCYEKRLAELSGGSIATASASGKDSIANRKDAEEKAAEYAGLGDASLVVSRVNVQPGEESDTFYIGRRAVSDVETRETVVVLWTAQAAEKWAKALPEAPGEVLLRRQLRCAKKVVEAYVDEISVVVPTTPSVIGGTEPEAGVQDDTNVAASETPAVPTPPTPSDVAQLHRQRQQPPDDFLLRELQRSRSGSMRDIVETIRRDQMDLVTGSPADILVVQGGPGTGKSAVGLHRVTWLVNNDHFKAQDLLVIGPHERFLDYVGQVLPTLGTRNINAVQMNRLWDGDVLGTDTPRARLVKSDDRMAAVLRRRVEHECRPDAIDEFTTTPTYKDAKPELAVTAGSTTLRIPRSEVLVLLQEAREGDGSYRERRNRFRSLLVDRLLQELVALAPRRSQGDTIRRDLERNRQVERLIERVWQSPGDREALRSLYDSPELLRTCADGVLDPEQQAALHRPRAATADADLWTLDDRVCLEELRYLITGETPQRYGHIVIDEAQDLTPMQARSLRRRIAVNGSMTVLGDLAQATGPHAYADWDRIGTLLSDHGDWHVAELNTSYRVPAEIMEFVAPLARTISPSLPYPRAVREAGADSVRTLAAEPWTLLDETVTQTTRLVGTSDGHTLRRVAVIVPDDSGWLDEINRHLDQTAGLTEEHRATVSVLAAAHAKGMEYDHVLVVEPATIADRGPAGLRQLYVALTRSTQSLTVLHTSPLPDALMDTTDTPGPGTTPTEPSMAAADVPEIGTDIRVRVLDRGTGGRYKVQALSPPVKVPLILTVRHGSTPPRPGEKLDCWVFAQERNHCLLTTDQRGRQPISAKMAERYLAALGVFDELTADGVAPPENGRERLSELKGMANRVLRRDQADWVDVRRVLGSPDRQRLNLLRDLAAETNRALKDDSLDVSRLRENLARTGWSPSLAQARETLQHRMTTLTEPTTETAPTPSAPQPEQEAAEPMASAEDTAVTTPSATNLLHTLETTAAADRTCKKHEAVRHALMSALFEADEQATSSQVVDVSRTAEDGDFLYEILGAGHSAYTDLRSGAARLLEINHTLAAPADRLYLVLTEPPAEDWSAETLLAVYGVHLLWRTHNGWAGRDKDAALGSAQP